ncbi:MAG: hypothetical protein ABJA16_10910 [Nakamurella sp.]
MPPRPHRATRSGYAQLLRGGLPTIFSSGVVAAVPIAGAIALDSADYAVWALGATLSTVFVILDFGVPSLAIKLSSEKRLDRGTLWRLMGLTATPPLVLCGLVSVAWPFYSAASGVGRASSGLVYLTFGEIAVGTAMRSVGVLYASVALGRNRMLRRAMILIIGAVAQLVGTLVALALGAGFQSLGIGILCGGLVQVTVGIALERCADAGATRETEVQQLVRMFMKSKGIATLLGVTITQFDRWAVGLATSPTTLAVYDIATRFALIPKIALVALGAGLVAQSAQAGSLSATRALVLRSQKMAAVFYLGAGSVLGGVAVVLLVGRGHPLTAVLLITIAVTLGHGVNSLTIPAGYVLSGVGRPDFELRYLWPLAGICLSAYGLGIWTHDGTVLIALWSVAMIGLSWFFVRRSPRYVEESRTW